MTGTTSIPCGLRQDLQLHESGPTPDGAPAWVIQDPVRNRFFRIGWLEYECLLRWPNDPERIAQEIATTTPLAVDAEQVVQFGRFLEQHQLLLPSSEGRQRMVRDVRQPGWQHWRWWLHHYLFIRIPLIRPQRFLAWLTPRLAPLFSRPALLTIVAASLLGIALVAQQWEVFTHSVLESLTPSGLLGFVLAIIVSKTLHELGHAVVATRQGVRVAHMGIAFLVMWPMLYTDTGESWRLRSHKQRLAISSAGMGVEIALAGLATLLWALLDDGALRQATLYLATTGWVLSLALNLSPFMRFDGYFVLSDLTDLPNLHERAGWHARVWLRRTLLGLPDAWPEPLALGQRIALIGFALLTWIYRLVVFLGIAWMVYAFFFKALGVFLMLVELTWFIGRPIWQEMSVWQRRWPKVPSARRRLLHVLVGLAAALLIVPWRFDVNAYGVAHVERQQLVFAPFPSRLTTLTPTGAVASGDTLAGFDTPDLLARESRARSEAQALRSRMTGLLDDNDGTSRQRVLAQQLEEQLAEIRSVHEELARLLITAQFAGEWRDVSHLLRPGTWIGVHEPLGVLIDPKSWIVDAWVEQRLVDRIETGAQARFFPEGSLRAYAAEVIDIDSTRTQRLPYPLLDSRFGGMLQTRMDGDDVLFEHSLYHVRLQLQQLPEEIRELRGSVHIEGRPRSLAWEALKGSLAVVVRESGF